MALASGATARWRSAGRILTHDELRDRFDVLIEALAAVVPAIRAGNAKESDSYVAWTAQKAQLAVERSQCSRLAALTSESDDFQMVTACPWRGLTAIELTSLTDRSAF